MTELSADWVLPLDGPPLSPGRVRFEDGVIVEVAAGRSATHHEDAAILPGSSTRTRTSSTRATQASATGRRSAPGSRRTSVARADRRTRDGRAGTPGRPRLSFLRNHDDGGLQLLRCRGARRRRPRSAGDRLPGGLRARPGGGPAPVRGEARPRGGDAAGANRRLAARALQLLAGCLPLVPVARHPGRHPSRRERQRERMARARHRAAAGDRPDARAADRAGARSERSSRCSAQTCSAPTASRSTRPRSRCSRSEGCRSRTARARTPCSAAGSHRSPSCAPPGCAWGSGRTRRPRPRPSTCSRRCGRRWSPHGPEPAARRRFWPRTRCAWRPWTRPAPCGLTTRWVP